MYTALIEALGLDCHSDLLLNKEVIIEAVVESVVGMILCDFFGEIAIGEVKVIFVPATCQQTSIHWLRVLATCSNETIETPVDLLQARLEHVISCELLEHFHIVVINNIDVHKHNDASSSEE
jgi:hypothetical protein